MKIKEYYTYYEYLKGLNFIDQRFTKKEANKEKTSALDDMSRWNIPSLLNKDLSIRYQMKESKYIT